LIPHFKLLRTAWAEQLRLLLYLFDRARWRGFPLGATRFLTLMEIGFQLDASFLSGPHHHDM